MVVIGAFALPLAMSFARLWTSIYTAGVPNKERQDRRAEILSDLHEQVADFREQGYRPDEIAILIVRRVVRGMKDDVAWSAPYLPEVLAEQFERGSEALRHIGTPKFITTAMAVVGMMNCAWLMSDGDKSWVSWFIFNGGVLTVFSSHGKPATPLGTSSYSPLYGSGLRRRTRHDSILGTGSALIRIAVLQSDHARIRACTGAIVPLDGGE